MMLLARERDVPFVERAPTVGKGRLLDPKSFIYPLVIRDSLQQMCPEGVKSHDRGPFGHTI